MIILPLPPYSLLLNFYPFSLCHPNFYPPSLLPLPPYSFEKTFALCKTIKNWKKCSNLQTAVYTAERFVIHWNFSDLKNPRFIIESGFKSRAGYNGARTVDISGPACPVIKPQTALVIPLSTARSLANSKEKVFSGDYLVLTHFDPCLHF